jgi:hypothetical protein
VTIEGWIRFQNEYPGEVVPDRDCQVWFSVIETPKDEALLFENLPAHLASRKFRDGFAPSAKNFLFDGHWKVKPKPDVVKSKTSEAREGLRAMREAEKNANEGIL